MIWKKWCVMTKVVYSIGVIAAIGMYLTDSFIAMEWQRWLLETEQQRRTLAVYVVFLSLTNLICFGGLYEYINIKKEDPPK